MKYNIAKEELYPWDNAVSDALHQLTGSPEFLEGAKAFKDLLTKEMIIPSKHQINDEVILDFHGLGIVTNCKIIKVHFAYCKVLYDVELSENYDSSVSEDTVDAGEVKNLKWTTRLYNVDSCFVKSSK